LPRSEGRFGDDTITLWVDVTCGSCSIAAEVARAAAQTNHRFLNYKVVGFDSSAVRAATILEVIHKRDPRRFSAAVEEFLSVLPQHPDSATELASDYLDSVNVNDLPEWPIALSIVQDRRKSLGKGVTAPFADIDGLRIGRDDDAPFGEVGFDPFADKSLFNFAVKLVRNCGGPNVK